MCIKPPSQWEWRPGYLWIYTLHQLLDSADVRHAKGGFAPTEGSPGVGDTAISQLSVEVSRCLFAARIVVLAPISEFHTLLLNSIVMWGVRLTSVDESRHYWFLEASSGPRSLA